MSVEGGTERESLGEVSVTLVPTPLSLKLRSGNHPDAARAFALARRSFIAGKRIDMGELAAELDIDRTSLFRWVGNRDALLSEVIWSLAIPTLDQAEAESSEVGARRVTGILTRFVEAMIDAKFFREFLRREPSKALRLLTTKQSEAQRRHVAITEHLLATESAAGTLTLPLPAQDLAYLLVRISESFTYADLITGDEPSARRAEAAFELVLRAE